MTPEDDAPAALPEKPGDADLLAIARRRFLEDGYDGATMRDIAADAGIAASRLYVSYASKKSLYVAVLAEASNRLVLEYLGPVLAVPQMRPWDRIMAIVEAYLDFYLADRETLQMLVLASLDPDDPSPVVQEMIRTQRDGFSAIATYVQELMDETGSDLNPEHVLRWGWAGIFGLAALNVRLPHLAVDEEEFDKIVALGMRLFRTGLRHEIQDA